MSNEKKRSSTTSEDLVESPRKTLKNEGRYGSSGTEVTLTSNYFRVNRQPEFNLTQYCVDFQPNIDVTAIRKKLIADNRQNLGPNPFGSSYIFDGGSLYLCISFPDREIHTTYNGSPMTISLRRIGSVDNETRNVFQLYNNILRDAMAGLRLQNIRRDYYDPHAKIEVPMGRLELWPGYITSIRSHDEGEVLMCAEISHKVMRQETVHTIANRIMMNNPGNWQETLKREVIGTTVLTEYTNKTYQIDDIDFSMTPNSTFTEARGNEVISYLEYYNRTYNIQIQDRQQFMLISNASERNVRAGMNRLIHLIPELCRATGMTDEMRQNFPLMKEMSEYTRLNPDRRVNAIENFNRRIQETPEATRVLAQWQMGLERTLLTVPGRELPPETMVFGNNRECQASERGDWAFREKTTMFDSVAVKRWIVVYPKSMKEDVTSFLRTLYGAFDEMQVEYKDPFTLELEDDKQGSYIQTIRDFADRKPKMILFILPSNRADRYSALKKVCFIECGIQCQVVIKKVIINRNARSIANKIAIQINAKMGGRPWMIKMPVKSVMTVGFDVSIFPQDRSRSIGALVASMDLKKTGAIYSTTTSYQNGNEMNHQLAHHMKKALETYKKACGTLPEKIIFYRDGVGEGQIQYVHEKEIKPLLQELKKVYCDEEPKLAYIIVNKRTNSRFFKKLGSMHTNPKPGTVVDRMVTLPERNDFFLVSQHVGQGTVSPTAYNVIYNNSGLSMDRLEILTYKFTHLYYNWSGTTRIPAVCQYAKKLAFLSSQSLGGAPVRPELEQSLYFL